MVEYEYITEQSRLDEILPRLVSKESWGFDLETNGRDPHVNRHILAQIGRPEETYLIDTRKVSLEPLKKPFFENEKILKVGQMLKFDYKFLRADGIKMESPRDSFIIEKVLTAGKHHYLSKEHKLDCLIWDYLNIRIENKSELQKSFIGHVGDFSKQQLDYAAGDVVYQIPLVRKQIERATSLGLIPTILLECEVIPAFGDMEFDGMKLNAYKWQNVLNNNIKLKAELEQEMRYLVEPYIGISLFGDLDINYGSPKQILELLQQMKVQYAIWDREQQREITKLIDKTDDKTLLKVKDNKFVKLLKQWRSLNVRINTFGIPYIDAIHPKTGCIHPDFWQIGTATGRPAAGDSDVNPLNIPREQVYRDCFDCEDNEVVESDDYSGCESRILTHISGDPVMTEIFKKGEDFHSGTASRMFKLPVSKDQNKHLRTPAKAINFGMAYGQGKGTLYEKINAEGFKVARKEAYRMYDDYCDLFHVAVTYLRDCGREASKTGTLSNLNGRRRWWKIPEKDDPKFMEKIAAIEREGGNFKIQSVNADITKEAMIQIRKHTIKNNIRSKFVNAIYDEIVTRTHKDDSPEFHKVKLDIMQKAGEKWIKTIPMVVDGNVGSHWQK